VRGLKQTKNILGVFEMNDTKKEFENDPVIDYLALVEDKIKLSQVVLD
jgi:hypothetical protein